MQLFSSIVIGAVLVYAGLAAIIWFNQNNLLFLPDVAGREITSTPADIGADFEEITIDTEDGQRLHAWFIPAPQSRVVLLFLHGNAGNISHRLASIGIFRDLGLDVLIFDYRGYGRSTGRPSEQGVKRDAEAAWAWLTEERGVPAREIVVFGRSLGGSIAAWLAARYQPCAVIIESAFTSVPDMAAQRYPWLPVRLLSTLRFDTVEAAARIQAPVLVVHSEEDDIIPFAHGQKIYAATSEPKAFLRLRGGHNDGFMLDRDNYVAGLQAFLDGLCL